MTIGLLCAIPEELEHLRALMTTTSTRELARIRFDEGLLDGHRVVLAGTGMGKVNAAVVTTLLAETFGCRVVVFSGVAGGLDPALHIGDVVVADRIVQHDVGRIENDALLRYQAGHVSFINPTDALGYSMDADLLTGCATTWPMSSYPRCRTPPADGTAHHASSTAPSSPAISTCTVRSPGSGCTASWTVGQSKWRVGPSPRCAKTSAFPGSSSARCPISRGDDSALDFSAFVAEVAAISAHLVRRIVGVL